MNTNTSNKWQGFYSIAWRWHFYAGLIITPILLMLAITGIIYLFKPQIENQIYKDKLFVSSSTAPYQSADQLILAAKAAFPQATLSRYQPPVGADRSAKVVLNVNDVKTDVFINPYTGVVLGSHGEDSTLESIALKLHGELLIGPKGDFIIEFAVSWTIVLLVSGIYLWWPRGRGAQAAFWPRFDIKGRAFWRDLHAVTGFWSSLLILFMLISGLLWAGIWGGKMVQAWSYHPAAMWDNVPKSDKTAASLNTTNTKLVPWAVEPSPIPKSDTNHAQHHHAAAQVVSGSLLSVQQIVDLAKQRQVIAGYDIAMPDGPEGVYTVTIFADNPLDDTVMHVDQYSGKVLADVRFKDYGSFAKVVSLGTKFHEGRILGFFNQMLMLGICLMLILSCVSGVIMWWKRKPTGKLGAPTTPNGTPYWKGGLALMVIMGIMFPLVGASFLLILLSDWTIKKFR